MLKRSLPSNTPKKLTFWENAHPEEAHLQRVLLSIIRPPASQWELNIKDFGPGSHCMKPKLVLPFRHIEEPGENPLSQPFRARHGFGIGDRREWGMRQFSHLTKILGVSCQPGVEKLAHHLSVPALNLN